MLSALAVMSNGCKAFLPTSLPSRLVAYRRLHGLLMNVFPVLTCVVHAAARPAHECLHCLDMCCIGGCKACSLMSSPSRLFLCRRLQSLFAIVAAVLICVVQPAARPVHQRLHYFEMRCTGGCKEYLLMSPSTWSPRAWTPRRSSSRQRNSSSLRVTYVAPCTWQTLHDFPGACLPSRTRASSSASRSCT